MCIPNRRKIRHIRINEPCLAPQRMITSCWTSQILVASPNPMTASGDSAIHSARSAECRRQTWLRFNVAKSTVGPLPGGLERPKCSGSASTLID
jgi:hypothetical protein